MIHPSDRQTDRRTDGRTGPSLYPLLMACVHARIRVCASITTDQSGGGSTSPFSNIRIQK